MRTETDGTAAGPMTPEKLRTIATTLDLFDVILERIDFKMGDQTIDMSPLHGTDMQADLRRWADELEASESV